jgi:DNA-binding NtrC family response regulator
VILLSAVEDLATAVEAIKEGASTTRPSRSTRRGCCCRCERAAEQHALRREVHQLRSNLPGAEPDFGSSRSAQELRRTIELVAPQTKLSCC